MRLLKTPRHLLIFRFSSLGDIAMTVPVIQLLLQQYPQLQVTVVSNGFVAPLFEGMEQLHFYTADLKGRHKGVNGLFRLYKELKHHYPFDAVADLHNVLRTKILRFFFSFSRKPIAFIDKGREEKKALTRKENKILKPLKTTFQRYADVFAQLQLPVQLIIEKGIKEKEEGATQFDRLKQQGYRMIGIAPFAQYERKMYPLDRMKEVLRLLLQQQNVKLFLFGGGRNEIEILQQWEQEFQEVQSLAGKMSFKEELQRIAQLDVMVSMDSANMHLASLYGVPVISVWGATHPFAGFYGWGQPMQNAVQVDLWCRPCSVFGNKPGYRNDLACLYSISPLMVYQKVLEQLETLNK